MFTCALLGPAQVDARIGVGHGQADLLAVGVLLVDAVRQDDRHVRVHVRRRLDAPIDPEDEVAELLLGPERLVAGGFALGVVVDDAVDDFPVAVVAGGDLPAREVLAVEERREAVLRRRRPRRSSERERTARWQELCAHGASSLGYAGAHA